MIFFKQEDDEETPEDDEATLADDLLDEVGEDAESTDDMEGFGLLTEDDTKEEEEEEKEEDEEEEEATLDEDAEDVDFDTFDDVDEM